MPWTMLLRAVVRIATSMLIWRMTTARRAAAQGNAASPPLNARGAGPPFQIDMGAATARVRDAASLGWRGFSAAVLLLATALLTSGGVTLTALSPRWLGIAMLVLAAAALTAAIVEVLAVRRLMRARAWRRRAEELRRQLR